MPKGYHKDKNRMVDICLNPVCTKLGIEQVIGEFPWSNKIKGLRSCRCKTCMAAYDKKRYQVNPKKRLANTKKWAQTNPERKLANNRKWQRANPEKVAANGKKWYGENCEKVKTSSKKWATANPEKIAIKGKRWRQANPGKVNAYAMKRRAAKLYRTPKWADLEAIQQFIINCPEGMTVDHIIPLQGKKVSGLHVLDNLQYLTISDNRKKNNKFDPIAYNNLKKKV
jgi:hypothetical protein